MIKNEALLKPIRSLLQAQNCGVLATHGSEYPYATLVGYATSEDCRELIFATIRDTRKYENIKKTPNVSLLIDSRMNQVNDFHWAIHGMTPNVTDRPEVEYFSYEEQESYTPIFVEMDSSINPIEIGAFVNDSCVGATTVFEDDSTVLILAYTDDLSGDISFEQHYGYVKN